MKINQKYDKNIDAVYLKFSDNKIYKTKELRPGIIADFDWRGLVVGIEVLNAVKRNFKFSIIKSTKKNSQKAEIYTSNKKVNFPIPAYL